MAQNYICKWCGIKASSVANLSGQVCTRNPVKGNRHELYEGSEKSQYTCKFCGVKYPSIQVLTGQVCVRHPTKGRRHEPAL